MRPGAIDAVACGNAAGVAPDWIGAARADDDPFGDFVSPISNPVNFEDPRSRSDVRLIYAHHAIDRGFAAAVRLG